MSDWRAAIIVTLVPVSAVRDPHVREWFYEVPVVEAKERLTTYPDFPITKSKCGSFT